MIDDNYLLDVYTSNVLVNNTVIESATVQINEQENTIITLESSILENINNLEIQKYNDFNLTLTNLVYANLPDAIPMSIITGNLSVNRIDGLDNYLTTIPIDGGTP